MRIEEKPIYYYSVVDKQGRSYGYESTSDELVVEKYGIIRISRGTETIFIPLANVQKVVREETGRTKTIGRL